MNATDIIERPAYMNRIRPFMGKDIMKVLVGQRRVGKSCLLMQIMREVEADHPAGRVIYINKELDEFRNLRTADDLLDYIAPQREQAGSVHLFIDEVQDISEFERALRSLQASGGIDIYCTGSNANLLSGELATLLSGRYVEIKVFGLSYSEFLRFHDKSRSRAALLDYLRYGGLPYLRNLTLDDSVVFDYLRNILDAILLKDVVGRYHIRNVDFLQRLVRFLADNTGGLVSARSISDFLKAEGIKVSHTLVLDYLSHLTASLLVFRARRCEIRGKKILEIGEKYYFEDLGLRHALVGFRGTDIGQILENIIYNHLRIAGYDVWVGQLGDREVDFVAESRGERIYVQAAYQIPDEKVRDREFGNLLAIRDNYPKFVVTMDEIAAGSYQGIRYMHVEEFCHRLSTGDSLAAEC